MKWIKVEDKLPEAGQRIIVAIKRKKTPSIVLPGLYTGNGINDFYVNGHHEKLVTHWMPLPEPPELMNESPEQKNIFEDFNKIYE